MQEYKIGIIPSPSITSETIIQNESRSFLIIESNSGEFNEQGFLIDLGYSVVEFVGYISTRMGYPNDEGIQEHELAGIGMLELEHPIIRTQKSDFYNGVISQLKASHKRIWSARNMYEALSDYSEYYHYCISFKESTFDGVGKDLRPVGHYESYSKAIEVATSRLYDEIEPYK